MRNLLFFSLLLFLFACEKNGDPDLITEFDVIQNNSDVEFTYASNSSFEFYEIIYIDNSQTTVPTLDGKVIQINTADESIQSLSALDLEPGTLYSFWVRGLISNTNEFSNWFGPQTLLVSDYCAQVSDVVFDDFLTWNFTPAASSNASFFVVEYGDRGFQLGDGIQLTTSELSARDMILEQGVSYDAYIQSSCASNAGSSNWAGPYPFFADDNFNLCDAPSNIGFTTEYNANGVPIGATFTWTSEGNNKQFECNLVANGFPPVPSGNAAETVDDYGREQSYFNITPGAQYDFYIRAKCVDGSSLDWVGPIDVVIN